MKTIWKRCLAIFLTVLFLSPAYADGGTSTGKAANAQPALKWVTDEGNAREIQEPKWETDEENTPETKPSGEPTAKAQAALKKLNSQQALQRERIHALKRERILDYDISAVIDKDASMTVTERITVNVENMKIKRGITRTYPIKMRDGEDGLYKFGFELLSTKLDGKEAKHKSLGKGMMYGMAIGDGKKTVPRGVHTYEIVYRTTGHVRPLDDHDEIYYNAIGLDAAFPVDKASFRLILPDGTKPTLTKAYTGKSGERGEDYRMTGEMSFATTRPLAPKEAFTVIVGWPKGVVAIPEQPWLGSHRNIALAIILGIVVAVLAIGWFWQFQKNKPPVVYPIFTPPTDMSPGKAAYINSNHHYSPLVLQADLIWTAIKGYCRMDTLNPESTVFNWQEDAQQTDTTGSSRKKRRSWKSAKDLPGMIANALFAVVDKVVMGYENAKSKRPHSSLTSAWNNLYQYYRTRLKDNSTAKYGTPIAALVIGYIPLVFILDNIWHPGLQANLSTLEMVYIPAIICGIGMLLLGALTTAWDMYRHQTGWRIAVCGIILGLVVLAFLILWLIFSFDTIFTVFYWLLWMLPTLFFMKWNRVLTPKGKEEKQVVDGLKMYINTAEKHRLELINAPEDNVDQYEAILPYAIALDCADAWQKRYAPILARLNYVPEWMERPATMAGTASGTWDEHQRLLYEERLRNRMYTAMATPPPSVTDAINQAIAKSQETQSRISSSSGGWHSSGGGFSSGSSGSSGGGSGGGGVGGW